MGSPRWEEGEALRGWVFLSWMSCRHKTRGENNQTPPPCVRLPLSPPLASPLIFNKQQLRLSAAGPQFVPTTKNHGNNLWKSLQRAALSGSCTSLCSLSPLQIWLEQEIGINKQMSSDFAIGHGHVERHRGVYHATHGTERWVKPQKNVSSHRGKRDLQKVKDKGVRQQFVRSLFGPLSLSAASADDTYNASADDTTLLTSFTPPSHSNKLLLTPRKIPYVNPNVLRMLTEQNPASLWTHTEEEKEEKWDQELFKNSS